MKKPCYVIGVDYGTLSARAVVVDASDGAILSSCTYPYPHAVMTDSLPTGEKLGPEWALASGEDYDEGLIRVIRGALAEAPIDPMDVVGIGVDGTSFTMVLTDEAGEILSKKPEFARRPHAHIKLWKHHTAQPQALRLQEAAEAARAPFLARCGFVPSCEWALPKLMEVRELDREVYDSAAYALDLCDYITWKLTGKRTRSLNSAGFKSNYVPGIGYPDKAFLSSLYEDGDFGEEYHRLMDGPVLAQGACIGPLDPDMADQLGLSPRVMVGPGMIDGHTSIMAVGMCEPGEATLVVGTSIVLSILSEELAEIPGVCGVCMGGFGPDLCAVDTGQNCTGDMLNWYMENALPASVEREALAEGISPHDLLSRKAAESEPWNNSLTVMDWWNGNRNILCDMSLRGSIQGLSMDTRPEDIYCALMQGIVCGTRHIIERCAEYGAPVKKLVCCGGIPCKNPFLMQQYANILHMPVEATTVSEGPALGSAVFGAMAAGLYPTLEEAEKRMMLKERVLYTPDLEHADAYERIYRRSRNYHDLLGNMEQPR